MRSDVARIETDWPLRRYSRFVAAGGVEWHVQQLGTQGPRVLLLHGSGASTHSWRDLGPALARDHRILAVDLPGHAYTSSPAPAAHSLDGMTRSLAALLQEIGWQPQGIVGHSAGAAIIARGCLDGAWQPSWIVSICGAILPLTGLRSPLIGRLMRPIVLQPLVPRLFARRAASPGVVERLLRDTGSSIDARGLECYRRLAARPEHVAGALAMMGHWDVRALERDLHALEVPALLIAAQRDRMIPPSHAQAALRHIRNGELRLLKQAGHLAHEEQPEHVAELIRQFASSHRRSGS